MSLPIRHEVTLRKYVPQNLITYDPKRRRFKPARQFVFASPNLYGGTVEMNYFAPDSSIPVGTAEVNDPVQGIYRLAGIAKYPKGPHMVVESLYEHIETNLERVRRTGEL